MKIAFISDIHSNIEALQSVLERVDQINPDKILCGGDLVGYCANPKECLNLIRQRQIPVILCNHDEAMFNDEPLSQFNDFAKHAILWTRKQLDKTDVDFLHSLPYAIKGNNFILIHANLHKPEKWGYLISPNEIKLSFKALNMNVGFVGHTHLPFIHRQDGVSEKVVEGEFILDPKEKYIINLGSVGQPRDRDNRACFVVYDDQENKVVFHRVKYNFTLTQEKILENKLHPFLAMRLEKGQ